MTFWIIIITTNYEDLNFEFLFTRFFTWNHDGIDLANFFCQNRTWTHDQKTALDRHTRHWGHFWMHIRDHKDWIYEPVLEFLSPVDGIRRYSNPKICHFTLKSSKMAKKTDKTTKDCRTGNFVGFLMTSLDFRYLPWFWRNPHFSKSWQFHE